jgi:hypothetical protein
VDLLEDSSNVVLLYQGTVRTSWQLRNQSLVYFLFTEYIITSSSLSCNESSLDEVVTNYDNILRSLLDKHAAMCTRTITHRPNTPWYNDELRQAKREKRRWERKYVKTGLVIHTQIYQEHCRKYQNLLESTKTEYYKGKVTELNHHQLFKFVDSVLNVIHSTLLPKHDSSESLAELFSEFFEKKILDLRQELSTTITPQDCTTHTTESCVTTFSTFHSVSLEEIQKTIVSSNSKSCALDPIPIMVLKECCDCLLPSISHMLKGKLSAQNRPFYIKVLLFGIPKMYVLR